ncbi:MAG: DUF2125 domain-containing protein [Beijerinckiaceae bacterium]|nr:DUF2125 domain-containing protein [Beijerinckiaceae bacterium]
MAPKATARQQHVKAYSWLLLPAALLLVAAIGWLAFWLSGSRHVSAALTAWMVHEAQLGRTWSCPGQKIGGFPFSFAVTCHNPSFQGAVLGEAMTGTMPGLRATAPLFRSGTVTVHLDSPLAAASSSGAFDVSIRWNELQLEFDIQSGPPERLSLRGNQLQLRARTGGRDPVEGAFGTLSGRAVRVPHRQDNAYDVSIALQQGSIPALSSILDTDLPLALRFEGTISQLDVSGAAVLADFFETWRAASGRVDIALASLTSGRINADAKGSIGLDSEHRAQGKLDARFSGFDKALRRLDIDPAVLNVGQALSGLLGGGQGGGSLTLPLILSDGFLRIGAVRTTIQIPPLY